MNDTQLRQCQGRAGRGPSATLTVHLVGVRALSGGWGAEAGAVAEESTLARGMVQAVFCLDALEAGRSTRDTIKMLPCHLQKSYWGKTACKFISFRTRRCELLACESKLVYRHILLGLHIFKENLKLIVFV